MEHLLPRVLRPRGCPPPSKVYAYCPNTNKYVGTHVNIIPSCPNVGAHITTVHYPLTRRRNSSYRYSSYCYKRSTVCLRATPQDRITPRGSPQQPTVVHSSTQQRSASPCPPPAALSHSPMSAPLVRGRHIGLDHSTETKRIVCGVSADHHNRTLLLDDATRIDEVHTIVRMLLHASANRRHVGIKDDVLRRMCTSFTRMS